MLYHTLFLSKIGKDVSNLSSAAVVIGALRVKSKFCIYNCSLAWRPIRKNKQVLHNVFGYVFLYGCRSQNIPISE